MRVLQKGIVVNRNLVIMVRFANVNRSMTTNNISSVLCNDYMCNMKRKSTLVDSVSAEPEVSAVGRKRLSSVVIPQNKENRLRNVSCEPVYAAPLARRSQSPTRRRATFNSSLLTVLTVSLCLFFSATVWGQSPLTVCDGTTTNSYVPFYGYMGDAAQHNQMIYPGTNLTSMVGKLITEMSFYVSSGSTTLNDWDISLGTTTASTLSGLDNTQEHGYMGAFMVFLLMVLLIHMVVNVTFFQRFLLHMLLLAILPPILPLSPTARPAVAQMLVGLAITIAL